MQNKIILLIAVMVLTFTITGCGGSESGEPSDQSGAEVAQEESTEDVQDDQNNSNDQASDGKVLVAYFTRIGNTGDGFPEGVDAVTSSSLQQTDDGLKGNAQMMAEWIADETGGDLFAIESEDVYPADYNATVEKASKDQGENTRPKLTTQVENIDQYEKVAIVFPNWWADLPMPVYSFFDQYDLSGKEIAVYVTHEGSGFSDTVNTIKELEPDATITEALSLRGGDVADSEQAVRDSI